MLYVLNQMDERNDTMEFSTDTYPCRYALEPFEDCYCCKLTGKSIPKVVLYCMNDYRMCPVYCRKI